MFLAGHNNTMWTAREGEEHQLMSSWELAAKTWLSWNCIWNAHPDLRSLQGNGLSIRHVMTSGGWKGKGPNGMEKRACCSELRAICRKMVSFCLCTEIRYFWSKQGLQLRQLRHLWRPYQAKFMQKARDSTKPIILGSASIYTLVNAGRHEKAVNSKNVCGTETSRTSSCGQEHVCQVLLAVLPSGLKNGGQVRKLPSLFPARFSQRRALQGMSQLLGKLCAGTRVKNKNCTGSKSHGGAVMWVVSLTKPLESVTKYGIGEIFWRCMN